MRTHHRASIAAVLTATLAGLVLSMAGAAPAFADTSIAADPSSVDFGSVPLNTTATRSVSITVDADYSVEIAAGSGISAPFSFSFGSCSSFAGPGSCSISEQFTPTATGPASAELLVDECPTAGGSCVPATIELSGTGFATTGADPSSLDFGNVPIGSTATRSSTITVDAGYSVQIAAGSGLNAPFGFDFGTCVSFAGPGTCAISETFSPTAAGPASAAIFVDECPDVGGSCIPAEVTLSGTGGQPAVGLSAGSVTFPAQGVDTTSSTRVVTLTNTGTAPLHLGAVTSSGDFAIVSNTCASATVAPGGTCTVGVAFRPTSAGPLSGSLDFQDDAADQPQSASLTGTGVQPTTRVTPTRLDFGAHAVGTTSPSQTVTVVNTGAVGLVLQSMSTTGDFALSSTGTCIPGLLVAPGDRCTVEVSFSPAATGTRHGALVVNDTSSSSPHVIPLLGSGTPRAPGFMATPGSLSFARQRVGTTSSAQTIVVANTGGRPLIFNRIGVSGDFVRAGGTCSTSSSVAAGHTCTVVLKFRPTANGTRHGAVTFADNAATSPQTVILTGAGAA